MVAARRMGRSFASRRAAPALLAATGWVLLLSMGWLAGCRERAEPDASATAGSAQPAQRVEITVTAAGFEPAEVHVKQGQPAVLAFTRVADSECLNAVRMPWMKEVTPLPMGKTVEFAVDTGEEGTFTYSCWMSMVFGRVVVDPR